MIQPLWKMVWRFLRIKPPYYPAISLVGIYPEETKIEKDTCIPLFIAALLTIASTWKQPRCPSTDEWIKKLWYIYTMDYYSAIKRNTFESVKMPHCYTIRKSEAVFCNSGFSYRHTHTFMTTGVK